LYRLNPADRRRISYCPPIPVEPFFGVITPETPLDEKLNSVLWIPAYLVSRIVGQFRNLENEADEMFSIGVQLALEILSDEKYHDRYDIINGIVYVQCQKAMETWANGIQSVVKLGNTTRYRNWRKGVKSPKSIAIGRPVADDNHDVLEMEIRDVIDSLGFDPNNMTPAQKRVVYNKLL